MSLRDDLKAFIDQELDEARAQEIQAALESDPQLRAEYEDLKSLTECVREFRDEPEVIGLERVLLRVGRRPWWHSLLAPKVLTSAGALAGVVLVLAVIYPAAFHSEKEAASEPSAAMTRQDTDLNAPATESTVRLNSEAAHSAKAPEGGRVSGEQVAGNAKFSTEPDSELPERSVPALTTPAEQTRGYGGSPEGDTPVARSSPSAGGRGRELGYRPASRETSVQQPSIPLIVGVGAALVLLATIVLGFLRRLL